MPNVNRLIKTIDAIIDNTNNLTGEDKQSLIILKQKAFSSPNLNAQELEEIQYRLKAIVIKYYHDLDELEKLIPPEKPKHPPRTAR